MTEKGALCIPSAVKNLDAGLKIYVEKHGSEAISLFDASSVGQLDVAETRFDLDGKIKMEMKYPSMDFFIDSNMKDEPSIEDMFKLSAQCIDKIYDDEEIYDSFTLKEAQDFIEGLNSEQFQKVQQFFDTIPKLRHDLQVTNPKTNVESTIPLEGLAAFFG